MKKFFTLLSFLLRSATVVALSLLFANPSIAQQIKVNPQTPYEYDPDVVDNPMKVVFMSPSRSSNTAFNNITLKESSGSVVICGLSIVDTDRRRQAPNQVWEAYPAQSKDFQMTWTLTGKARFGSETGSVKYIETGMDTENLNVYIAHDWNGEPLSLSVTVKDMAIETGVQDPSITKTWNFLPSQHRPTSVSTTPRLSQPLEVVEINARYPDAKYENLFGPDAPPQYKDETILESFGTPTADFALEDLNPDWLQLHQDITSISDFASAYYGKGNNSSFVLEESDTTVDGYGGFATTSDKNMYLPSTLSAGGYSWHIIQTYSCGTSTITPSFTVTRTLKKDFLGYGYYVTRTGP